MSSEENLYSPSFLLCDSVDSDAPVSLSAESYTANSY